MSLFSDCSGTLTYLRQAKTPVLVGNKIIFVGKVCARSAACIVHFPQNRVKKIFTG